jgi:hypothetical protein
MSQSSAATAAGARENDAAAEAKEKASQFEGPVQVSEKSERRLDSGWSIDRLDSGCLLCLFP